MSDTPAAPAAAAAGPSSVTPSAPPSRGAPRSARRTQTLAWSVTVALGLLIVVLIGVLLARKPAPMLAPAKELKGVATLAVAPRQYWERLELPARLEADRSATLSSELAGRLDAWLVEEGAAVEAGQEVVRFNSNDLEAQRRQLEARHASAKLTVAVAEQNLNLARLAFAQAEKNAAALTLERETARAALTLATKEFSRSTTLAAAAIATQADFDRAENAKELARLGLAKAEDAIERAVLTVQAAAAGVTQAEATLALNRGLALEAERQVETLQVTLAKTLLRAPFAGRFEERLVEVGEVVSPGQPLGRLYDLTWLRAAVDVPDRYAPLLDTSSPLVQKYIDQAMPGAVQDLKASLTIPGLPKLTGSTYAGIELPAIIQRVAQAASPTSNTFRVELRLLNPGNALKAGIIGRATLSFLRYDQAIVIPVKALQVAEVGPRVLVVETVAGRAFARVRDIEPLSIQNDEMLIRGGLNPGDQLVVSGAKGIVDGEEVRVVVADGKVRELTPVPAPERGAPAAATPAGEAPR
jgi:RND family efflux transporter MFP subunit